MRLIELDGSRLEAAVDLFAAAYAIERESTSSLPEHPLGGPDPLRTEVASVLRRDGVAAIDRGRLIGYMCAGFSFPFKGLRAGLCPVIGHAAEPGREDEVYPELYAAIGRIWAQRGDALHVVEHLAHSGTLERLLYALGFGMIVCERVRDLASVEGAGEHEIVRVEAASLARIDAEHARYYRASPIFVHKESDHASIAAGLREIEDAGCVFLACLREGEPIGYCAVGPQSRPEGLLLRNTGSAQLRTAYVREPYRRTGVGRALLGAAVTRARDAGFDRIFVEHETANTSGSAFWARHFHRYVRFSMRYVDPGSFRARSGRA